MPRLTPSSSLSSLALAIALVSSLAGCPRVPVGIENVELPADSAKTCQSQCGQVGLQMQSMVIMAGHVGCVCSPASAPSSSPASASASDRPSPDGASGAAGGLAAILVLQQQQQASQQQQQQAAQQASQQQQQ